MRRKWITVMVASFLAATAALSQEKTKWEVKEGDYVAKDFKFRSGETLP